MGVEGKLIFRSSLGAGMNQMKLSREERFLNLAMLNIGEALVNIGEAIAEISNLRQRGQLPGNEYNFAEEKLQRAICALHGKLWVPEVAEEHKSGG